MLCSVRSARNVRFCLKASLPTSVQGMQMPEVPRFKYPQTSKLGYPNRKHLLGYPCIEENHCPDACLISLWERDELPHTWRPSQAQSRLSLGLRVPKEGRQGLS